MNLETQFEKQKLINAVKSASDINQLREVTIELLNMYFSYKQSVTDILKTHHNLPGS
jgi:hypothetical protein